MKKTFKILLTFVFSLIYTFPVTAKVPNKGKLDNSLLWRITQKGTNNTSYLFGTMHLICADDYFWTNTMNEHFLQTQALCLEMNLDEPDLMSSAGLKMIDLSGKVIKDYFKNENDYTLFKHYVEDSLHQNMNLLQQLKPIALYLMFSLDLGKSAVCKESVSYELKLVELAHSVQKKISGLESLDEQLSLLENIPTDSIINQMLSIAKGNPEDKNQLTQLTDAYKKQDLNALHQMMNVADNMSISTSDLLDKRNEKWIPRMGEIMRQQSTFFAVGAGHLYGLIELLRKEGYQVESVK
jgi:uncharacterized protein